MLLSVFRGYLAPEYASYGDLSEKADVYSFGVLCLEVISGRKNVDQAKPVNQVYLPSWVIETSILYGMLFFILNTVSLKPIVCVVCFLFWCRCFSFLHLYFKYN